MQISINQLTKYPRTSKLHIIRFFQIYMFHTKYKKWHFVLAVIFLIFLFYKYAPNNLAKKFHSVSYGVPIAVTRVIDGDTIELANGDRLRYIGIDTPEEFDPRKPIQCFAKEAALENKNLVEGKNIIFYKDISAQDKYGRWLGLVYLTDGTFVNQKLVAEGFAFNYPYKPDTSHERDFKKAETEAKKSNLGLWAHCQVYKTASGREQTNNL